MPSAKTWTFEDWRCAERSTTGFDQLQHLGPEAAGPALAIQCFQNQAASLLKIATLRRLARQMIEF